MSNTDNLTIAFKKFYWFDAQVQPARHRGLESLGQQGEGDGGLWR